MTDNNLNEKTSCNCKTTCNVPPHKKLKKKGVLGFIAAMAICCMAPFGLAIFAGSASLMPLLVWVKNPIVMALLAFGIGAFVWLFSRFRRKQV